MEDSVIVDMYWERNEQAITESHLKYGRSCQQLSMNILNNIQDAEECVNDTWLRAWNSMPPQRPTCLGAYLSRITRNLSLDKLKARRAACRCPSEYVLSLDELRECVPDPVSAAPPGEGPGNLYEEERAAALGRVISRFLRTETEEARKIFVSRYYYNRSVKDICQQYALGESKVKSTLFRIRERLKKYLEKEGISV